ncbi:MAG: flagellin [Candidatus Devosia phytovorans]|uniref:Flagellin n=1 Tax=Candidatus Devosia phytovorans TaxID=3121372 RepID=A0AAJ5VVY5_9HYPH|nr:flagellin [Devosia sp.]WEK05101.1 MAG: flagellin [Devosia sp.]
MVDINLSKSVRSNLSSLQNTASLMNKTSDRLSTGNKVNSALDNPTNFFTASSLNSRAGDLNQLMDSMANGIKTIEAADNGLTAITKNLESMQSTLRQARQDKSFQTKSFTLDNTAISAGGTVKNLTLSGGAIGDTPFNLALNTAAVDATDTTLTGAAGNFTNFAGGTIQVNGSPVTLRGDVAAQATTLNGAGGTFGTYTGGAIEIDGTEVTIADDSDLAAVQAAIDAELGTGYTVANAGGNVTISKADGTDIEITGNSALLTTIGFGTTNRTSTNGVEAFDATAATVAQDITDAGIAGLTASGASGQVVLTLDTGADLAVTGADALLTAAGFATANRTSDNGVLGTEAAVKTVDQLVNEINGKTLPGTTTENPLFGKVRASNDNGKLRIENLSTTDMSIVGIDSGNNVNGGTGTSNTSAITGNTVRSDLANQFNELRDQLDKLADDASFNGINLLRGDNLKITFNETGTSSIDIQTKGEEAVNSASLGVSTSLTAAQLDSDTSIDGFIDQIKGALGKVRSQSSTFGSNLSVVQNRQDFTQKMINTLETGAGNLTLADMNQEAANMMALQTRQSLASSTLSMANTADQNVLQLLR